jgi:hypothetical protein
VKLNYLGSTDQYFMACGYASELREGGFENDLGLIEAESMTLSGGASSSADGSSSGGNLVTYTMTTTPTQMAVTAPVVWGSFRVFARAAVSAGTATVQLGWAQGSAPFQYNPSATLTSTAYRWIDLGVVSTPRQQPGLLQSSSVSTVNLGLIVNRGGTAGNFLVDFIFLIPLEYYWSSYNSSAVTGGDIVYDSTIPWHTFAGDAGQISSGQYLMAPACKTNGMLRFPPGNGSFYFISGTAAYVCSLSNTKALTLYYVPQYHGPRGST